MAILVRTTADLADALKGGQYKMIWSYLDNANPPTSAFFLMQKVDYTLEVWKVTP